MNVRCPQCQSVFRVDPEKVPANGIRARCARCNATFSLSRSGVASTSGQQPAATPIAPTPASPVATAPAAAGAAASGMPASTPAGTAGSNAAPAAREAVTPQTAPSAGQTPRTAFAAGGTTGQARAPYPAVAPQPNTPVNSAPSAAIPAGSAGAQSAPAVQVPAGASRSTPPARPQDTAPPSRAGVPTGTRPTGGAPKRASFAKLDPNVRAQRLARALVSDIVAYNKEKREAALQGGTLKTEFREEIRKSWEEYVAQVGLELARSTPFFRDSLNEILAKGQPLF